MRQPMRGPMMDRLTRYFELARSLISGVELLLQTAHARATGDVVLLANRLNTTLCKAEAGGRAQTLWTPLYESNIASAKSMIATFFRVFTDGMIFSNDQHLEGYDAVLLGHVAPARIDVDGLQRLLDRDEYLQVKQSLADVGFGESGPEDPERGIAVNLLATFAGQASDLRGWAQNAKINRDKDLRLQCLAGMWFNSYLGTKIFQSILHHYRFPDNLFTGSDERMGNLKKALADGGRREGTPVPSK